MARTGVDQITLYDVTDGASSRLDVSYATELATSSTGTEEVQTMTFTGSIAGGTAVRSVTRIANPFSFPASWGSTSVAENEVISVGCS